MQTPVPASGGTWSEQYQTPEGSGVSIKINNGDQNNIVQFEYTIDPDMSMVFYDLSLVNGNPLRDFFQTIVPDDTTCPSITCQPGQVPCPDAYNSPDENSASHGCTQTAGIRYYLCGGP